MTTLDTPSDDEGSTMRPGQLRRYLGQLRLNQTEAAKLYKLTPRSMRGYVQEGGTPVPQAVALSVWQARELDRQGLWWRPPQPLSTAALEPRWPQERAAGARRRIHDLRVPEIVERVSSRGGPVTPWDVDLERGRASLGTARLYFTVPSAGGFVPLAYKRTDQPPEPARDAALLEDGYACIARALARAGKWALPLPTLSRARLVGDNAVLWDERPAPQVVVVVARADVLTLINHARANDVDVLNYLDSRRPAIAEIAFRFKPQPHECDAHGVKEVRLHIDALRPLRETFDATVLELDDDPQEAA